MEINPSFVFERFITNDTNRFAAKACEAFAESGGVDINPLLLYGESGVGKTHLAQAAANALANKYPNKNIRYVTAERFTNEMIEGIRKGFNLHGLREEYRSLDILIFDSIEFVDGKLSTSEELFHIIDELLLKGKSIIVTTSSKPSSLFRECPELRSRIDGFCSIGIDPPDEELISEIMDNYLHDKGLQLGEDIKSYILEYVDSRIPKTMGVLNTLWPYSELMKTDLQLWHVKRIFRANYGTDAIKMDASPNG